MLDVGGCRMRLWAHKNCWREVNGPVQFARIITSQPGLGINPKFLSIINTHTLEVITFWSINNAHTFS